MRLGPAGERHSSSLLHQARFLIANLELEIQITAVFSIASIFLIANILRFFKTNLRAPRHSSLATALLIETPRLKLRINRAFSATSNFLIETKCGFCIPKLASLLPSPLPPFRASRCSEALSLRAKSSLLITRHSSPITHFASAANLCDNGWLKLRL